MSSPPGPVILLSALLCVLGVFRTKEVKAEEKEEEEEEERAAVLAGSIKS